LDLNVATDNESAVIHPIPVEERRPSMEDEEDDQFDDEPFEVALAPFAHQVGGHSALLLMDKSTVCKPLISRELRFYEQAPDALRPFLASYKGKVID
jgi:hypothetical protein